MRWLFFLLLLLVTGCRCDAAAAQSETVDAWVKANLVPVAPGIAVAVLRKGEVLHRAGYGLADVEAKTPVTPETVFDIASVAKQMTGMAVLLLRERGKLSLEDDVRTHLPELPAYETARPMRIDDLSRHTSGLPPFIQGDDSPLATEASTLEWLGKQSQLEFEPGESFKYENLNYFLLARIVERVAKKPFGRFLGEEVFEPAGMKTAVLLTARDAVVPNRAVGYANGKPARWDDAISGPANVLASLDDMIAWDQAVWSGRLLPDGTMLRALEPGRLTDGRPVGYALGWGVTEHLGKRVAWHDGDWIGASAYIAHYLDDGLTIVLLSNGTGVPLEAASRRLAEIYL
jgi:CubicO group peptidase (beta-lactamase class C family)